MSHSSKTWLGIVAVVIIGVWYMQAGKNPSDSSYSASVPKENSSQEVSSNASGQTSLASDVVAMDKALDGLDSDSVKVDKSLQDQPVAQTE